MITFRELTIEARKPFAGETGRAKGAGAGHTEKRSAPLKMEKDLAKLGFKNAMIEDDPSDNVSKLIFQGNKPNVPKKITAETIIGLAVAMKKYDMEVDWHTNGNNSIVFLVKRS